MGVRDPDAAHDPETEYELRAGTARVLLGGLLGGLVGTAAFGLVTTLLDLGFVRSFVPALFGLPQEGVVGWAIHLSTGAVLGLVFAAIVSRDAVVDAIVPETDEPQLGPVGMFSRLTAAGFAYGLAIWALLPTILLPIWMGYVGTAGVEAIPGTALETLAAHVVFGLLLGLVYAFVVSSR